ncbi:MAG: hypothetical protein FJ271_05955 [Planctomycetes bacterium]|nr:hypothetical protein [Planctomycetota bacterium]
MGFLSLGCGRRGMLTVGALVLSILGSLLLLNLPGRWLDLAAPFTWTHEEATPESATPISTGPPRQLRLAHLAALGADSWHKQGLRGDKIKVAILDSSFRGYRDFQANGLPADLGLRSFRMDRNLEARDSQHGLLCAEVVHAIAPGAELLLANWEPDRPESFLDAVRWARSQGAKVISCSLIMPSWSDGEGGGPIHGALEKLVGTGDAYGDLLFFASAGNIAQRHWAGSFRPDDQHLHQWVQGKTGNTLRPWGKDRVAVELYGKIAAEYELTVIDRQAGMTVGQAVLRPSSGKKKGESCCAGVRYLPRVDRTYEVRVRQLSSRPGQRHDKFHLVVLGGFLEHSRAGGSIPFPGDGACVQAVGAVDANGRRLFYSACGPNSKRLKPDFVAPVPFPSEFRERAFAGTSAAAPQAAALAALMWSRNPGWTASKVRNTMQLCARDLGPAGHDWETGFGAVHLP